jgi:hypothetical protein
MLEEKPGTIDQGRRPAALLQLEILDASAQTPDLRERALRNEFGNQIGFCAFPEP